MSTNPFTLSIDSYNWAINHLIKEGDTDLLPPLFELEAINFNWSILKDKLVTLDLSQHKWQDGRRFVVPKDQLAFRIATQLAPLDNLLLAALIKEFGSKIEAERVPVAEKRVFSYRFNPSSATRFYEDTTSWKTFWETSYEKASQENINWIVVTDITDYYNQIYHHTLENELRTVGIPDAAIKCIIKFISRLNQTVSRGIPVGPHSVHLLAELAFNPIDRSMLLHHLDYCRYVDDIHIFCKTEQEARIAVYDLAKILDTQQRLTLNKQKTVIYSKTDFIQHAKLMMEDAPQEDNEKTLLEIVNKYSNNNRYTQFEYKILKVDEKQALSSENLEKLFDYYLTGNGIIGHVTNYTRIRWLLRRLAQFGIPNAINYTLTHIDELAPALGDVANYIMRASNNFTGSFTDAGELALKALENPVVAHSDYLQLILLNLFSKVPRLDHVDKLTLRYNTLPPALKREIVLAAKTPLARAWIKERKEEFGGADLWLKTAILSAIKTLPGDEPIHWVKSIESNMTPIEKIVVKWTFQKTDLLGDVFFLGVEEERARANQEAERADKAESAKKALQADLGKTKSQLEKVEAELKMLKDANPKPEETV